MSKHGWICDTCGRTIEKVEDGWVEWLSHVGTKKQRGFRLVHHVGGNHCQYDGQAVFERDGSIISDQPVREFVGADGLMLLLLMISEGELPKEEVVEMTKRLHVPGYEHARRHFKRAIAEGVFEPNMGVGFYSQDNIKATLKFIEKDNA